MFSDIHTFTSNENKSSYNLYTLILFPSRTTQTITDSFRKQILRADFDMIEKVPKHTRETVTKSLLPRISNLQT